MKELKLKDGEVYDITEKEFKKVLQAVNGQNSVYIERLELLVNPFHIAKVSTPQALLGKEILMDSSGHLNYFDGQRVHTLNRNDTDRPWSSYGNYDWESFLKDEVNRRGRKLDRNEEQEARQKYVGWINGLFIPADQYLENKYSESKKLNSPVGEESSGESLKLE